MLNVRSVSWDLMPCPSDDTYGSLGLPGIPWGSEFCTVMTSPWGASWGALGDSWAYLGVLRGSWGASRRSKMRPRRSKMCQDARRSAQDAARRTQDAPRGSRVI